MTTAAAASITVRTARRLRSWRSVHALGTEAAAVLALYGLSELALDTRCSGAA
jgi:hypothetical protein